MALVTRLNGNLLPRHLNPLAAHIFTLTPYDSTMDQNGLHEEFEEIPFIVAILTMINYAILTAAGHIRDIMRSSGLENSRVKQENIKMKVWAPINRWFAQDFLQDFPPLYRDFDSFYTRNLYMRIRDCWNRPICSVPGRHVTLMERETKDYGWNFKCAGPALHHH